MTAWFNTAGDTGITRYILVSKKDNNAILSVYTKPDNKFYAAVRDASGNWNPVIISAGTISVNTWNFTALNGKIFL